VFESQTFVATNFDSFHAFRIIFVSSGRPSHASFYLVRNQQSVPLATWEDGRMRCDTIRYDTIFGRILQQLDLEFPSVDKSLDSSRDSIKWVKIRSIGIRCNKYYFLRIQIMMCPNCRYRFPQSTRLLLLVCSRLRIATAKSVLALRRNDSAWNVSSLVFSVLPPCCHDCSRIRSLADVSSKIEICKTQSIESFV
jgi:hypothetical protein